mmetsp:Transcript_91669/g.238938  ORF Transcript_91669/g.238938 Transcript_91669/m.238938 type:complete len:228 (+) Transcript_91669:1350-2033(+)
MLLAFSCPWSCSPAARVLRSSFCSAALSTLSRWASRLVSLSCCRASARACELRKKDCLVSLSCRARSPSRLSATASNAEMFSWSCARRRRRLPRSASCALRSTASCCWSWSRCSSAVLLTLSCEASACCSRCPSEAAAAAAACSACSCRCSLTLSAASASDFSCSAWSSPWSCRPHSTAVPRRLRRSQNVRWAPASLLRMYVSVASVSGSLGSAASLPIGTPLPDAH